MTLVLTINGPETIWVLTDRRLTVGRKVKREDACKIMDFSTKVGGAAGDCGLLAYAGLGATAAGTQPSDWMSNVLRGRGLSFEQSLHAIARAMNLEFPKHVRSLPGHVVLAPAFVDGEPQLFSISMVLTKKDQSVAYRVSKMHGRKQNGDMATQRFGLAGSGGIILTRDRRWARGLLGLVSASDNCKISRRAVADYLARLNLDVSKRVTDNSVGPRSMVVWRSRRSGVHRGGGGSACYNGTTPETGTAILHIAGSTDMRAVVGVMMPIFKEMVAARRAGDQGAELDTDAIDDGLSKLDDDPDEELL